MNASMRARIMKDEVGGSSQRSASTVRIVAPNHRITIQKRSRVIRRPRLRSAIAGSISAASSSGWSAARGFDRHALERRIVVALALAGFHSRDLVDHVHAFRDATEHRITEIARLVIEKCV